MTRTGYLLLSLGGGSSLVRRAQQPEKQPRTLLMKAKIQFGHFQGQLGGTQ